jgi:hypothetical protein
VNAICEACGAGQGEGGTVCARCARSRADSDRKPAAPTADQSVDAPSTLSANDLKLDAIRVCGYGPDATGELVVECTIDATLSRPARGALARLQTVVLDSSCTWPLCVSNTGLVQAAVSSHSDRLSLQGALRFVVPPEADVHDLAVRPTILLYPVDWVGIGDVELRAIGRVEHDVATGCGDLEVTRWWITARASVDELTAYEIGMCVTNRGKHTLAQAVARVTLRDPAGRELWIGLLHAEGMGPDEERVLSSSIALGGVAQDRGAIRLTLSAGGIQAPVVLPLAVWEIEIVTACKAADRGAFPAQGPERLN